MEHHELQALDTARPHVLWIDHGVSSLDARVRFLELDGFDVECVGTGHAGLAIARAREHAIILLDVRLPDTPGLAVLARMRAEGINTPVLVLTAFGDIDAAFLAGRFGASGFETKALFVDELAAVLRDILAREPDDPFDLPDLSRAISQAHRDGFICRVGVIESLHRLTRRTSRGAGEEGRDGRGVPATEADAKRMLEATLVRALADAALPVPAFLACAVAFRRSVTADAHESPWMLAVLAEDRILEVLSRRRPSDSRILAAIAALEAAVAKGQRPTEGQIAESVHIDASHLGRLLYAETGVEFGQWKKSLLVRKGVRHLIETREQVKQIACCSLGYTHESQFDREFSELLGLSPREFRRLSDQLTQ